MKKYKKNIFLIFTICLFGLNNVQAKQNIEINLFNTIHVQDNIIIDAIENKRLDTTNFLCYGKFGFFLEQVMLLIKFAVPVIIIAFSVVDFIKAMSAQKSEEIKNAANKLVKRLIIGAIIFLLPTIIDFLLNITGINSSTCGW